MAENDLVLYLLMRKDMDSFNHAGKMLAQAAHAANHAAWAIGKGQFGPKVMAQWADWENQTPQGFGTTLVYGGITDRGALARLSAWEPGDAVPGRPLKISDIRDTVDYAARLHIAAGVVNDPSYPLQDGKTMHAFPCDTCAWIFGSKSDLIGFLSKFHLHPLEA